MVLHRPVTAEIKAAAEAAKAAPAKKKEASAAKSGTKE
jgi:hypothetical protein